MDTTAADPTRVPLVKARIFDQLAAVVEVIAPPLGSSVPDFTEAKSQVLCELRTRARSNQDKALAAIG